MTTHPHRNRLAVYGGRIIQTDDRRTVEMVGANDNAHRRFQYRCTIDGSGIERRVLQSTGEPFLDTGSPWEVLGPADMAHLISVRGRYHPILNPLGF